jgi:hypothetical protein
MESLVIEAPETHLFTGLISRIFNTLRCWRHQKPSFFGAVAVGTPSLDLDFQGPPFSGTR